MNQWRADLPYKVRVRLADNLYLHRERSGSSRNQLADRALVSADRISQFEDGRVAARMDSYVRLAGALSITLDDLLAGVTWIPPVVESEVEGGYVVEFEVAAPSGGNQT